MRRALVAAGIAAVALTPAAAQAARCPKPVHLDLVRKPGATSARLSWQPARRTPRGTRYRIYRDRAVVGQTRRSWMKVRVSVGRSYRFVVRPVSKKGKPLKCMAKARERVAYVAPTAPGDLAVQGGTSGATVHLAWSPSKRGDARLAGYRVLRSGATFKQTPATGIDVPVANDRVYQFTVAAVDVHGKLSAPSAAVTVDSGHLPPPPPQNVIASDISDSELTLSWAPSQPARGRVAGYRVYRDGRLLRQVQGLATRVTNLAAASSHTFTVAAIDSSGWLSAQSAPASVSTAPPVQSTGRAQAFLLASTDRSFADFRAHYTQIGVVYPTYFDCSGTQLVGHDNSQITQWAQQRGVKVLPRFNCQSGFYIDKILNDPSLRAQWLDAMVSLVQQNGYDGVNLDFEAGYAADRSAYTSFVTELASRLHASGKLLTIDLSAKTADVPNHPRSTFFDYIALSQQADWMFVMAWGVHWSTSTPGAQDDMQWLRAVVSYVDTMPDRGRFVIGMQLYGMDWPNGGGSANPSTPYEYSGVQSIVGRVGATPLRDPSADAWHFSYQDASGVPHDVWFPDVLTTGDRIQLAHDNGLGVGFWRLGTEDQRLWDLPLLAPGA